TKRDIASFGGTRSVSMPKTGCNWSDGTEEPTPSSGSDFPHKNGSQRSKPKRNVFPGKKGFFSDGGKPFLSFQNAPFGTILPWKTRRQG
ncbi:hypothetical protein, partial [Enorma massiliensis]|uniref:hypothetical protein n=1 Tax=Enorma massiliensis TaxID=1472761 RepID=UPI003AB804B9